MPVGKKPAQVRRRKIVEEVKAKDEEKREKNGHGDALRRVNEIEHAKRHPSRVRTKPTGPYKSYRNPPVKIHETSCCLDKDRPLPEVFRQCPNCPKLTEAGS